MRTLAVPRPRPCTARRRPRVSCPCAEAASPVTSGALPPISGVLKIPSEENPGRRSGVVPWPGARGRLRSSPAQLWVTGEATTPAWDWTGVPGSPGGGQASVRAPHRPGAEEGEPGWPRDRRASGGRGPSARGQLGSPKALPGTPGRRDRPWLLPNLSPPGDCALEFLSTGTPTPRVCTGGSTPNRPPLPTGDRGVDRSQVWGGSHGAGPTGAHGGCRGPSPCLRPQVAVAVGHPVLWT